MDEKKEEILNEELESYLKLSFTKLGSVEFGLEVQNVSPMQLLAASKYLEIMGTQQLLQMQAEAQQRVLQQQARSRIARPNELSPQDVTTLRGTLNK